jgi:tRNA A22 N-methylase
VAKKRNPRIVKRRTKEQIRRSTAAKKGWQTRRVRLLEDAQVAVEIVKAKKKPTAKKKASAKKTVKELNAIIADLRKQIAEKWVPSSEDHMLHRDGTVAQQPCTLRHLKEAPTLIAALKSAERKGPRELRNVATYIAELYNVPVQEAYTLLFSP